MPIYEMTLDATVLWMDTGVAPDGTKPVTITATGQWTANPSTGMVDADGNPQYEAKTGYNLPGKNEGLLVGRIGESGTVFAIGKSQTLATPPSGELYISINDDMFKEYGAGFPDNQGSLNIKIEID